MSATPSPRHCEMTNDLCSTTTIQTPSCPKCGELANRYSRYEEHHAEGRIVVAVLVRLAWVCVGCQFSVDVNASPAAVDMEW